MRRGYRASACDDPHGRAQSLLRGTHPARAAGTARAFLRPRFIHRRLVALRLGRPLRQVLDQAAGRRLQRRERLEADREAASAQASVRGMTFTPSIAA